MSDMCDCLSRINESLKEHNTKLATGFCLSLDLSETDLLPILQTEKIGRGRKVLVIPTFCPFCGTKYPRAKDDPPVTK
jgi:hypothetical protein